MRKISWKPGIKSEMADREAFIKLTDQEKWQYLMRLIKKTKKLPQGAGNFYKRKVKWK